MTTSDNTLPRKEHGSVDYGEQQAKGLGTSDNTLVEVMTIPIYLRLTTKQIEMLTAFERDGEASDLYDFDAGKAFGWRNRERVITSLYGKDLLNDDGITNAGRAALKMVVE